MPTFAPENAAQDGLQLLHALGRFLMGVGVTIRTLTGKVAGRTANAFAAFSLDPALVRRSGPG